MLSTLFFTLSGVHNWRILTLLWALIPILNLLLIIRVPIYTLPSDPDDPSNSKSFFKNKLFWLFIIMMICAGAGEQSVSQWASSFAEKGLGVSKSVGDIAGAASFAFLMGTSRLIYGKYGHKIDLNNFISASAVLCILSYLAISLSPSPVFALICCGICGFSVGIF